MSYAKFIDQPELINPQILICIRMTVYFGWSPWQGVLDCVPTKKAGTALELPDYFYWSAICDGPHQRPPEFISKLVATPHGLHQDGAIFWMVATPHI